MSQGNASDVFGGAMSGAATGASLGGPWGALAGAAIGGIGGGLFGGKQTYGYSKGDLDYIAAQGMNTAQNNYSSYTGLINNYLGQAQNIASTTFGNYYGPSTIAHMAAMGLDPNSGATSSALAQQSMLMQGQLLNTGFGAQQSALSMLNNSQMQIRGAQLGGGMQNFGIPQSPSWMGALGQVGGSALNYSMIKGSPMMGNWSPFGGGSPQSSSYAQPSTFGGYNTPGFGGSTNPLNLNSTGYKY